jgi:signal transduction histidine kinase
MHIQSNPTFDKKEFAGYIGSLTDITDQMAAEQAILELMHKKDEFLSIASHELKTPLTSIKAYTQLLYKNLNPEEKTFPFVAKTLNHIARLEKLVRDLLDVSRINSGQMHYDMEPFQFEDLLKQSIENFRDVSSSHKIIIENIAKGALMADRIRIEQVFNNLLDNAAKYSPGADTILVNSFIENENIVVSVQDYGVGIAEKDWRVLFERFYRSEKTSNSFQGLGLGLFISSDIIKRHGGEIWVKSAPGAGSTFYFKLPLYEG